MEADSSLTGKRVVEVLERLKITRGLPQIICVDNGTEFTGRVFDAWAHANNIKLDFSRTGKPTDNTSGDGLSPMNRSRASLDRNV